MLKKCAFFSDDRQDFDNATIKFPYKNTSTLNLNLTKTHQKILYIIVLQYVKNKIILILYFMSFVKNTTNG